MRKTIATAATLASVAASGAMAATVTLTPGIYQSTIEFTSVTNDNLGVCASLGLKTGAVEVSINDVGGAGKVATGYTPLPVTTGSNLGIGNATCKYNAYPATITVGQNTPYTGTVNCTADGNAYQIVTNSGNGNIFLIDKNTYYINATSAIEASGTTYCNIITTALYLRTGK